MHRARRSSIRSTVRTLGTAALAVVVAVLGLPLLSTAASATAITAGYQDHDYSLTAGGPDEVTSYHSQNKLWFNDGRWWAVMWRPNAAHDAGKWTINVLANPGSSTQDWTDTGVEVDPRDKSHFDALSDGSKLYIAASNDNTATNDIKVFTYAYNSVSHTYAQVGSSASIPAAVGVSYASLAKSSDTKLWIGYASANQVWTASSTISSSPSTGTSWSTPAALSVTAGTEPIVGAAGSTAQADDIAVLVPITGGVGVMWSRTSATATDFGGFFFQKNTTGTWGGQETAWAGNSIGDNHISAKAATDGRVIVAVKSSLDKNGTNGDPLVGLLARSSAGAWTVPTSSVTTTGGTPVAGRNVATRIQDVTRPMLVLDEGGNSADVYFTTVVNGGDINRRVAPLSTLDFGTPAATSAKPGQKMIDGPGVPLINDSTSTKQPVDTRPGGTGLVVLASDKTAKDYVHSCVGGPCLTVEPTVVTATPASGTAPLAVSFSGPTPDSGTASWTFGDGGTASGSSVSHTYATAGTYTATYTGQFTAGPRVLTTTVTVTAPVVTPPPGGGGGTPACTGCPTASFTMDSSSGRTPFTVQFTDTSVGATSRSWNFGDGVTDTTPNPTHTYTASGTYTVTLTATNASGSTSTAHTVTVINGGARFTPVAPTSLLKGKAIGAGQFATLTLKPPPGTNTVALNVSVTKASASTTVSVCTGDDLPADCTAQTVVRARKGDKGSGFTITKLDATDSVKIWNAAGTAVVKAEVEGWFGGKTDQSYFVPQGNRRVLTSAKVGGNKAYTLTIPAALRPTGTRAVALNVWATSASTATDVSVCNAGVGKKACKKHPTLYTGKGAAVSTHVVTTMAPGGKVKLVNRKGSVRLTVAVQGVYTSSATGATFRPNPLRRVLTTQTLGAKKSFTMSMKSLPAGTSTVALRVTIGSASATGSVAVCPGGTKTKVCKASPTVPVQKGRVTNQVVFARVGPGGTVKFWNATGTTKITVDVFGSLGRT
jgi:PKD repeat protein